MPTIIKIGYQEFLVKSEKEAFAALKALCGAVKVSSRHVHVGKSYREVFWREDRESEVSIKSVRPEQLLAHDPGDVEVEIEPEQKQIGFGGRR